MNATRQQPAASRTHPTLARRSARRRHRADGRPGPVVRRVASVRWAVETLELRTFLSAAAAAGDLDVTFGPAHSGAVVTDFPTSTADATRSTALQSDGRIITLSGGADPNSARLSRYTANGLLDTTFGSGGSTIVPFPVARLAVRADDRIVLAGAADADAVRIARYTATGQPDTTFGGGDGQVTQPYFGGPITTSKSISKLLIEPASNRIYVAGTALRETYDFALAAFNEDGSRYEFFGDSGQYTTLTDFGHADLLNDAALTPDGHIVAVGSWTVSDSHHPFYAGDYAIVRWDQSGIPVTSFDGDGKTTVQFGVGQDPDSLFDTAQSVAFDAAGNIVVAGRSYDPQDNAPFLTSVARLTPTGALDPTFGPGGPDGDGRALLPLMDNSFDTVNSVAVLPTGKLLVAYAAPGVIGASAFALARLRPDGALDTSFKFGGTFVTDFFADDRPAALLIQSGKAILAGGSTLPTANPGDAQSWLLMARYLLDVTPPAQTPYAATPFQLPGTLQLENYDKGGEGLAFHDSDDVNQGAAYRTESADTQPIPASSGGGHSLAFTRPGEWTEYTFTAAPDKAGWYDLTLRYAAPRAGGTFRLELDGKAILAPTPLAPTGDWQAYTTLTFNGIIVTPGTHVLRLAQYNAGSYGYVANFDSLAFTRRREPFHLTPFNPGDTIQAEEFDAGSEGNTYHDTEPANIGNYVYRTLANTPDGVDIERTTTPTGFRYNVGYARAGEWLEYTINGPAAAAPYALDVRLASLRAGGRFHVELDGKPVASFTAPATGSWQTYTTLTSPNTLLLTPGRHVLRLAMDQNNSIGYVANFDWLRLRP